MSRPTEPADEGRSPRFYVHGIEFAALSTIIRERRQARRLAYTFDPGLVLAEREQVTS